MMRKRSGDFRERETDADWVFFCILEDHVERMIKSASTPR